MSKKVSHFLAGDKYGKNKFSLVVKGPANEYADADYPEAAGEEEEDSSHALCS